MGFLSRLVAGVTAPQVNITLGDDKLLKARLAINSGKYQAAKELLASTVDPQQRAFRAATLADWLDRPEAFDLWLKDDPEGVDANLVSAEHLIKWAWEARGGGLGNTVGEDAAHLFIERLTLASKQFQYTAQLAPQDPTPLASLLVVAKGLAISKEETTEIFQRAVELHPAHHRAHYAMLDFLCNKWYGSHDEMFAFARDAVRKAEPGSSLFGMIGFAHLERWIDVGNEGEDDDMDYDNYWKQQDVSAELQSAAEGFLANNSPLTPYRCVAANYLAMGLTLAEAYPLANRVFDALGDHVSAAPWERLGDPGATYNLWRKEARKKAGA